MSLYRRPLVSESINSIRHEVERAKKRKKVYQSTPRWVTVCNILDSKGWIEKIAPYDRACFYQKYRRLFDINICLVETYLQRNDYDLLIVKKVLYTKLLEGYQPDLIWFGYVWNFGTISDNLKLSLVNKLKRVTESIYVSKVGITEAFKAGLYQAAVPRTYNIKKDSNAFWKDFNLTAAMSLLKYVVEAYKRKLSKIISPSGKIPLDIFDFAIEVCEEFVKFIVTKQNKKKFAKFFTNETNEKWNRFHKFYFRLYYYTNHFKQIKDQYKDETIVLKANDVLLKLYYVWPYLEIDGYHNLWLLKPFTGYGGIGIRICRTKAQILNCSARGELVIQKYIERPLLIYNTKFDIRQWLIITDVKPLTIWMCKESYLRFSRETFSLRKLHEKIHFTNTFVQDKYLDNYIGDTALPALSVWSSNQFKKYLSQIGHANAYRDIIYPMMRESIIAYTCFHKDSLGTRRNCFEIFGADFILTQDFKPWLLEINYNPSMEEEKGFLKDMIYRFFKDVLEVVTDENRDKHVKGDLELIYKEFN